MLVGSPVHMKTDGFWVAQPSLLRILWFVKEQEHGFPEPSWVPEKPVDPFLTFPVTWEGGDGAKATARNVCVCVCVCVLKDQLKVRVLCSG